MHSDPRAVVATAFEVGKHLEIYGDIPSAKSTARKSLWRKHRVQSRTGHRNKQISTTLTVWRPREPEYTRDWSQMSRYWRDLVLVYIY